MNAAVYKSDGDLNEQGHKRAAGSPGAPRSAASVSVIERGSGNSSLTTSQAGGDDEGRHGSSKWCSPSTPCQLLGEARREIWHGSVLSTERIIGKEASSPATSGVLQPQKFWSSVAQMERRECLGKWGYFTDLLVVESPDRGIKKRLVCEHAEGLVLEV